MDYLISGDVYAWPEVLARVEDPPAMSEDTWATNVRDGWGGWLTVKQQPCGMYSVRDSTGAVLLLAETVEQVRRFLLAVITA